MIYLKDFELLDKHEEDIVYDLDEKPVMTKKWYELKNVRIYYDFFKENNVLFEKKD